MVQILVQIMNTTKASATLLLDTRRQKTNNKYPVKLTIYYNGQKERIKTNFEFTEQDWQKINGDKLRDDQLKQEKRMLNKLLSEAESAIDKIESFSFAEFKEVFLTKPSKVKETGIFDLFDEYIVILESQDRIGNASAYRTAQNSLKGFQANLNWRTLTKETLEAFESYLRSDKKSPSTVGIYMRHIRAIVNLGIKKGLLSRDKYPFQGYVVPASRNIKKALQNADLKKILEYKSVNQNQRKACDFWILSYLCNGMNIADICRLKQSNYTGEIIHFFRAKTMRTKKNDLRPIKVYLNSRAVEIIERYKITSTNKDEYLFTILEQGLTAKGIKNRIHDFIKKINEQMKIVTKHLEIDIPANTMAARHSFCTILKRKGADSMFIKESLGHSSLSVTENYLDDFEDEVKKLNAELLTKLD